MDYVYVKFEVVGDHGTIRQIQIEVDREYNCINVPPSGDLIGQENIDKFIKAVKQAAKILQGDHTNE